MPQALYRFDRLSTTTTFCSKPRRVRALSTVRPS
jgi:hypothetical protein